MRFKQFFHYILANWPLQSFSYFYLVILFTAGQYSESRTMCLGTNIREGRQFNMFMSENICTMVDLFNKAVAEGVR